MRRATDLTIEELKNEIVLSGEKPFRSTQIFSALHKGKTFDEMTDIPTALREKLKENFIPCGVNIVKRVTSRDGTSKFLFGLSDGNVIEGVLMKYKYGYTLCVSTQVGCRMNCAFCASGLHGLVRNLSAGEILGEILVVNALLSGGIGENRKIINVVLMGSGEPFDNYDAVVKFLRLLSDPAGINISPRNVSLSTCGLVSEMLRFSEEKIPVNLTVSLHSPFDEERKKIMPIAKAYKISEILNACSVYFEKTGRRYIFEYVLIKGVNDTERHAQKLISLLRGRPCHVNLIRLNEVKERGLSGGTEKEAYRFMNKLTEGGLSATVRRKMGEDINGACGQLRQNYIDNAK